MADRTIAGKFDVARTLHGSLAVLVAWQAGDLSEGQAAKAIHMDRITLREFLDEQRARGVSIADGTWEGRDDG